MPAPGRPRVFITQPSSLLGAYMVAAFLNGGFRVNCLVNPEPGWTRTKLRARRAKYGEKGLHLYLLTRKAGGGGSMKDSLWEALSDVNAVVHTGVINRTEEKWDDFSYHKLILNAAKLHQRSNSMESSPIKSFAFVTPARTLYAPDNPRDVYPPRAWHPSKISFWAGSTLEPPCPMTNICAARFYGPKPLLDPELYLSMATPDHREFLFPRSLYNHHWVDGRDVAALTLRAVQRDLAAAGIWRPHGSDNPDPSFPKRQTHLESYVAAPGPINDSSKSQITNMLKAYRPEHPDIFPPKNALTPCAYYHATRARDLLGREWTSPENTVFDMVREAWRYQKEPLRVQQCLPPKVEETPTVHTPLETKRFGPVGYPMTLVNKVIRSLESGEVVLDEVEREFMKWRQQKATRPKKEEPSPGNVDSWTAVRDQLESIATERDRRARLREGGKMEWRLRKVRLDLKIRRVRSGPPKKKNKRWRLRSVGPGRQLKLKSPPKKEEGSPAVSADGSTSVSVSDQLGLEFTETNKEEARPVRAYRSISSWDEFQLEFTQNEVELELTRKSERYLRRRKRRKNAAYNSWGSMWEQYQLEFMKRRDAYAPPEKPEKCAPPKTEEASPVNADGSTSIQNQPELEKKEAVLHPIAAKRAAKWEKVLMGLFGKETEPLETSSTDNTDAAAWADLELMCKRKDRSAPKKASTGPAPWEYVESELMGKRKDSSAPKKASTGPARWEDLELELTGKAKDTSAPKKAKSIATTEWEDLELEILRQRKDTSSAPKKASTGPSPWEDPDWS